jgi:hypothetical protein
MRFTNLGRVLRGVLLVLCAMQALTTVARAGGPRFVAGTAYCCYATGQWMAWYTSQPQYFTDPGDLSLLVSHEQADAMVAAAANVWNIPTSSIVLAQGGELAEHVSGDGSIPNTYFDGTEMVFPDDVQPANSAAIQIAVIYDTDGSVTDTLLGEGASDPAGCRQTGVTESVDGFSQSGAIEHAEIVLNGRCVTSSQPQVLQEQILQMQYQLTRAFGQVLGLAWSQLNDNVFTGSPTPTAVQLQHWPLMHPIDIVCGTYTYQCSVNVSTLTDDDRAALELLYPVGGTGGGKTASLASSIYIKGYVSFPDTQGMEDVNVTATLTPSTYGVYQEWQDVSAVSGFAYQQNAGNPVSGVEPASENAGQLSAELEARYYMGSVPVSPPWTGMLLQSESINPLYTGEYAIGPYQRPPIAMSGSAQTDVEPFAVVGTAPGNQYDEWLTQSTAPSSCATGSDGTGSAPAPVDPSGWWSGLLCPTGHSSWWTASVKANRTFAVETTALDEEGNATVQKMQPVLGMWDITDPSNVVMVGSQPGALNSMALGMTQLPMEASTTPATVEFVVADQYGAGRPDFAYAQRFLYADSLTPAVAGSGGGQITITGMGFRSGNQVTVNGVAATVLSWTSTQIVADVPPMAAADRRGAPVNVAVVDARTGGSTVIEGGLRYAAAADVIQVVSAPAALATGVLASTPFAVRVLASDGVAPVAGASVQFAVVSGVASMGCGASCSVTTDATGLAQTSLTGVAAGSVTISASITTPGISGKQTVQITMVDSSPVQAASIVSINSGINGDAQYLAAGASGQWSVPLLATLGGAAAAAIPVTWTATGPGLTLSATQGITTASGIATVGVSVQAIAAGSTNTVTGCVWATVCATWTVYGIAPPQWTIGVSSGAGQSVGLHPGAVAQAAGVGPGSGTGSTLTPVVLLVTDGAGHALPGATVTVFQTVYAWEGACPGQGACPAAPVLETSQTTAMSAVNGMIQATPLQMPGVAQVIDIAASTGTEGFVTMSLTVTP